jgi:predicted CoA-binding protein
MSWNGNPDAKSLFNILSEAKTIAVVGASSNPAKSSHGVMKMLQGEGYRCIPVNPNETEILGEKAYASLSDIPEKIDIVDVFRRPEYTPEVAREAVKIGAKTLWLQLGIANDEAAKAASEGGLNVVMDSCIAVEHRLLKVPRKP